MIYININLFDSQVTNKFNFVISTAWMNKWVNKVKINIELALFSEIWLNRKLMKTNIHRISNFLMWKEL